MKVDLYIAQFITCSLWLFLTVCPSVHGQTFYDYPSSDTYPYSLYHLPVLFDLSEGWTTSLGESLDIPFAFETTSQSVKIMKEWNWECELPDTMYLCIEGIGWKASLRLGEQFVGINEFPLSTWVIPIAHEWLGEAPVNITLELYRGDSPANYPMPFLGITQGIYVMEKSQLMYAQQKYMDSVPKADSVICWAPIYGTTYTFNDSTALKHLWHILQQPIRDIYFPFPPSRKLKLLCAQYGLREVDSIYSNTYVAMLNAYPAEMIALETHTKFWLDEDHRKLIHYGEFFQNKENYNYGLTFQPWIGVVLIIFFPFLTLFLIKIANANFFYSIQRLFLKPDVYIDTMYDITTGNPGFIVLLILIKIFTYTILITLGIFYIDWANLWSEVNLWKYESLLYKVFYGAQSFGNIFVRSLLITSIWQICKYSILALIGNIFNIRNFSLGGFNLDMVSIFPYMMLLKVPLLAALFIQQMYVFLGVIFLIGLVFFFIRHLYIHYMGLERLFNFSLGVKILYICAFKVLPYIIWF